MLDFSTVYYKCFLRTSTRTQRGGLKGAGRRQCRQWGLRDAPEYKLIYCIQGHHQLGTMHVYGHWQVLSIEWQDLGLRT